MTELQRHMPADAASNIEELKKLPGIAEAYQYSHELKTPGQGAATTLHCALSPETADGGRFYDDCKEATAKAHATNPEDAKRLWDLAASLVKL